MAKKRRSKSDPAAVTTKGAQPISRTVRLDADVLALMDEERARVAERITQETHMPERMGRYRFIRRALHSSSALLEWAKVLKSHGR